MVWAARNDLCTDVWSGFFIDVVDALKLPEPVPMQGFNLPCSDASVQAVLDKALDGVETANL